MCKSEHIFDDFFGQAIAINIWKTLVKTIFDFLEDGFKIFDRFENFTLSRNQVWNPPLYVDIIPENLRWAKIKRISKIDSHKSSSWLNKTVKLTWMLKMAWIISQRCACLPKCNDIIWTHSKRWFIKQWVQPGDVVSAIQNANFEIQMQIIYHIIC